MERGESKGKSGRGKEQMKSGMNFAKLISILLAAILVINFIALAARKVSPLAFWIVIILAAVAAYKIIPGIAKRG